jgi:hypothetical protein
MNQNIKHTEIRKNLYEVAIDLSDLSIDRREIESTIGYQAKGIPEHFSELIDEILSKLPLKCIIRSGYSIQESRSSTDRRDGLFISDTFLQMDKIVTGQLKGSEKIALFVCTMGPEMENWSRKLLIDGDQIMSYLVDTVASIVVENATNFLHDYIGKEMLKNGLMITNRYSPGYCNWSVAEQHLLFSFLPAGFCGIHLTDTSLMIPLKSVSGVIGIGQHVKWKDYICDKCGMKDCTYRSHRPSITAR